MSSSPWDKKFSKRIFTAGSLLRHVRGLLKSLKGLARHRGDGHIDSAFEAKIMLAVTAVNGCTYCSWFHSKHALKCGVKSEEIQSLLSRELGEDIGPEEAVGLLYAQRYAESGGRPDQDETSRFFERYGAEKAEEILAHIRKIDFGNLSGNTFDAFLSRLHGKKAENSSILFEFFFFLLAGPILLPAGWLMRPRPVRPSS